MSKKTFWKSIGLLLGCASLGIGLYILSVSPVNKGSELIWDVKDTPHFYDHLVFTSDGLIGDSSHKIDIQTGKFIGQLDREKSVLLGRPNPKFNAQIASAPILRRETVIGQGWLSRTVTQPHKRITSYAPGIVHKEVNIGPGYLITAYNLKTRSVLSQFCTPPQSRTLQYSAYPQLTIHPTLPIGVVRYYVNNPANNEPSKESLILWNFHNGEKIKLPPRIQPVRKERDPGEYDYISLPLDWVFSADGKHLYWVNSQFGKSLADRNVRVLVQDLITGQPVATLNSDQNSGIRAGWYSTHISPDESLLATINDPDHLSGGIFVFDLKTKALAWKYCDEGCKFNEAIFSPKGDLLACTGYETDASYGICGKGVLLLLDANSGRIVARLSAETWHDRIEQMKIKRSRIPARFVSTLKGYWPGDSGEVMSAAFSPDGKTLVASYRDGSLKLWRVPQK